MSIHAIEKAEINMNNQEDKSAEHIYKDKSYLNNNENWHQEDSPYKGSFVQKAINRNKVSFNTCVDIGCGAGLVTEIIAKNYSKSNIKGCDFSPDAKPFWNHRTKLDNLEFSSTDVTSETEIYDLVVCLDVFEHVEDYYSFLRSVKKVGRKFIFNIPLDMNVMKVLTNGIKYARTEVGHLHYFSEYTALETLKDCGFKIEDSFLSTAFLGVPPRNIRQLAALPFRLTTLVLGKSIGARIFGGQSLVVYAES
ncbi:class I SAM-dependent methyltransferase [Gammaproteobacteria bacterium]|nr:class I SAM-dependent methyltransferase [Gammaproteobacteria bacterium]